MVGDRLARVALSVLVYERTNSAGWTAVAYGLTYLPDLVSGPLLSGLAGRHPRRAVMSATDLARAVLVAVMAVPGCRCGSPGCSWWSCRRWAPRTPPPAVRPWRPR
ncbi:hypothetical protein [Saccharothrix lopnurensis]|uniref:MFS transporter n=1 Tax=Saccharothrix lopnurensis TaxID=1670621 RepID=A0ABW1PJH9_9PSEU